MLIMLYCIRLLGKTERIKLCSKDSFFNICFLLSLDSKNLQKLSLAQDSNHFLMIEKNFLVNQYYL